MSIKDTARSGCSVEGTTPESSDKIHDIVLNRRVEVCQIARAVGISSELVHNILHRYLDMR